jgi:hypothetical protein
MKSSIGAVRRPVPHQFHEPLRRLALNFEHHRPLQRAETIVHKEKRNENRRDPDRHEPLIADMGWRMKRESLGRKLRVKLLNQRLERRRLKRQPELGNPTLKQLLVSQCRPVGNFHSEIVLGLLPQPLNLSASAGCPIGRGGFHFQWSKAVSLTVSGEDRQSDHGWRMR